VAAIQDRLATEISDRYRIERELGAGGMATVYLAEDLRHHRKVAIKVLHPELSAVLGSDRFLKEIEVTANLQHPHILPLFDSGTADGLLYYVMPNVEGESLRGRLDRDKQLSITDSVRIASEVADALEYAHQRGVVHRDIKPENILLQGGHALVADFGIALAVQEAGGARMTQTGLSLGTPQYMAPEQAMGERDITARADIYALGAVAYEMIAGEPPFTGPNSQAIVARVLTETPRPLSRQRHTVPEHVEAAVMTALEKLPADRFETAAQFSAAIRGDDASHIHTTRRTAASRATATSKASLYRWAIAVAAALGIGAIAGWAAHRPGNTERQAVRFSFVPDSVNALETCCGFQTAVSPDERWVAYVGDVHGTSRIYVRTLDDAVTRPVAGTEGAMEVIMSPDGQWLGFRVAAATATRGGDYELRKVPSSGGPSALVAVTPGWPYGAAWMPDGSIVYASEGQPLHRVSSQGTITAISGTERFTQPRSVGDGRSVFVKEGRGDDQQIRMIDVTSGATRDVIKGNSAASYSNGFLFSVTSAGVLVAQRFDPGKAQLSGSPATLAENLSRPIDYAIGPTGVLFYGEGTSGGVLSTVDMKGAAHQLPFRIASATHFDNPRYSPDGGRLALAAGISPGHELYLFDLGRGTTLRMTFAGTTEFVDWTPDGRRLVYVKDDSLLAVQAADRSTSERVMLAVRGKQIARVSIGGRWVALAAHPVGNSRASDIYVVPLDSGTSSVTPYLATPFDETAPAVSPDGRWITYVSDETGRPEVYAGSLALGGAREVISSEGGREPVWSRDGQTLYYRTLNGNVMAATMKPGAQLAMTSKVTLFQANAELSNNGADFDVHPNGASFLVMRSRTVETKLTVVTNAFAQLAAAR